MARDTGVRKVSDAVDPMSPGSGTPWEDRGGLGLVKAFFATCVGGITRPRMLFNSIRRPETTSDASGFALGCGLLWSASALIHGLIKFATSYWSTTREMDTSVFWMRWGALALVAAPGIVLLMRLAAMLFHKLASSETRYRVPVAMPINLFAYSLAPSLLAPIPYLGPVVAVVGILVLLIIANSTRLQLTRGGAISCTVISFGAVLIMTLVVGFVGGWLWEKVGGPSSWEKEKPPPRQIRVR